MPLGEEYWWGGKKQILQATGRSLLLPVTGKNLYRTNSAAAATDATRQAFSCWVRATVLGTTLGALIGTGAASEGNLGINPADGTLGWWAYGVGFRVRTLGDSFDPSEWVNIVAAWDGNLIPAPERLRLWINGVEQTSFSVDNRTLITQAYAQWTGPGKTLYLAYPVVATGYTFQGYTHYPVLVDGQALDATSFGYFDANGKWQPKQFVGDVGVHGCIVDFSDDANLGKDVSGHGDFSLTAVTTADIYTDQPQKTYPLHAIEGAFVNSGVVYAKDRLSYTGVASTVIVVAFTHLMRVGKWYWEVVPSVATVGVDNLIGICAAIPTKTPIVGLRGDGQYYDGSAFSAYGAAWLAGQIIGVEVDLDANPKTIRFASGGAWGPLKPLDGGTLLWQPVNRTGGANLNLVTNFGAKPLSAAKPNDTKDLCAANQESYVDPRQYVGKLLYTGNGGAQGVGGLAFTPDMVWIKHRNGAEPMMVFNAVRGTGRYVLMNSTAGEVVDATTLTGFSAGGIALGASVLTNKAADPYIAYCFKKLPAAGFDIVTWAGDGVQGKAIPHALGKTPKVIIVKRVDATAAAWAVYDAALPANSYLVLNLATVMPAADATVFPSGTTPPTAANITVGNGAAVNAVGGTYVAFLFTDILGVSRFDSFTGTAAAYAFALGFRNSFSIQRGTNASPWTLWDNRRLNVNGQLWNTVLNTAVVEANDVNANSYAGGLKTPTAVASLMLEWSWAARLHRNTRATPPGN